MEQAVVTILKNNKIMENYLFNSIKEGEYYFSKRCLLLDKKLSLEDLSNILDDGYYSNKQLTLCLNSFNKNLEPTHCVVLVENNCIDYITVDSNEYDLKHEFIETLKNNSSNGDEYSTQDIDKCIDKGYERINSKILYYKKLDKL